MNSVPATVWRAHALTALRAMLRVALIGTVVAVILSVLFRQHFGYTFVYTLCITASCWSMIQGGLRLAQRYAGEGRPGWPPLPWTVVVVLLGTVLGYTVGNELGNLITGLREPGLLGAAPREAVTMLLFSLLIGSVFTWFFFVRERVARAEAQAQAAQRAAAENQLRLLESQLEPHMLFNTLANLRVLIGIDPPRAQVMLDHLIRFMRSTLTASRTAPEAAGGHTLADEFARIADYLALMQIRMGPRLQVVLDLPPELSALPVPPLLLQPLVENSIRHGLEPKVAGGALRLSARREGGQLRLEVRDTGVGLSSSGTSSGTSTGTSSGTTAGATACTTADGGTHFGLEQVRARLAALHGAAASLVLAAVENTNGADGTHVDDGAEGGTRAIVTLPCPVAKVGLSTAASDTAPATP